jgi:hypothetical protein
MSNSPSTEENPFKNIERIIIIVLAVWLFAVGGWFFNNQQIPVKDKLVADVMDLLEDKSITASEFDCMVDAEEDIGTCTVMTTEGEKITVKCSIKSAFFDFAEVFFAKGEPCGIADTQ